MLELSEIKDLFRNGVGKVVTFFVEHTELDYPVSEISKATKISNKNTYRILDHLVKEDVIEVSRRMGRKKTITMWKLKLHPKAIGLIRIQDALKLT